MKLRSDVVGSLLRPELLAGARAAGTRRAERRRVQAGRGSRRRRGGRAAGSGRAGRDHRRRDAPLRVLRPPDRRARRLRQDSGWAITVPRRGGARGAAAAAGRGRQAALAAADVRRGVHLPARARDAARQGDAHQRAAGGRLLRSGEVARRLPDARRLPGRPGGLHAARDRGARSGWAATYIQIDAPQYAALLDETMREGYRQRGSDPDRLIDACIEMDNAVIGGHPRRHVRHAHLPRQQPVHVLRLRRLRAHRAAGLRPRRFDRFLLEYDDERSGGFEPLRHVPDDRVVVLGLVSSKKPRAGVGGRAGRRGSTRRARSSRSIGWR